MGQIFSIFTQTCVGVGTGGISFRGKRDFACEILCPVYLLVLLILAYVDIGFLHQAFNGEIERIDAS